MRNKLKSFRRWLMNHPEANEEETTKYLRDRSLFGLLDFINAVYEYYDYIDFKGANEMLCNTLRYCLLVNIFPSISGVFYGKEEIYDIFEECGYYG